VKLFLVVTIVEEIINILASQNSIPKWQSSLNSKGAQRSAFRVVDGEEARQ
jgi:hypothetical protein